VSRVIVSGLLIFILIIAGLTAFRGEVVMLAVPLALYLLAGFYWGPDKLQLEVNRTLDLERVAPGDSAMITLEVTNVGPSLENLLLEDVLPSGLTVSKGHSRRLISLKKGEVFQWSYEVKGRRGYYPLSHLRASAKDLLGLVERAERIPTRGQLFVLPAAPRVRRIAIRPRMTRVYAGSIPARIGGPGIEFFGVREYQPGDPQHWINWRASARYSNSIFSNEFEQERVADVGIILDGRRKINELGSGRSIFEHSVLAATSLADGFIAAGNRVGLLVYGKYINWTYPGYGKLQREKILHSLARADLGESEIFSGLIIPKRLFPVYSQMVLVSPLESGDYEGLVRFKSAGYQLIVISPDPVSFEMSFLPISNAVKLAARIVRIEREILLHRLQRAGIQVVNWNTAQPFENVVQAALSRPPAWLRAIRSGGGM
jgi:uncharacterized repeat protein (TIGR01451 family)